MAELSGRNGAVYSSASTVLLDDTADAWTTDNATSSATDADIPAGQTGTSVKIVVPDIGAVQLLAHEATGTKNISALDVLYLWAKSSLTLTAGEVAALLDDTADCATPLKILLFPAVTSGSWRRYILDMGDASGLTTIESVGIRQVADLAAYNFFVKDVRALGFVDGIKSWTLDYNLEDHDTTDFADGQATNSGRTRIPGLSEWSGTFKGFKDGVPLGLGFGSTVILALSESQTSGQAWMGDALITNISPTTAVDDVVTITYSFKGTGQLTPATA